LEDNNCVNDTIEINWEDAPEGTTHYDPRIGYAEWKKYLGEGVWYYYSTLLEGGGSCWKGTGYLSNEEHRFIPKPEQTTEATCTEDSYTKPKADPFAAALNSSNPSKIGLADYLESIISNVEQEPKVFVVDMTAPVEQQGEDLLDHFFSKKKLDNAGNLGEEPTGYSGTVELSEATFKSLNEWVNKVHGLSHEEDSNVSWYDYNTEKLTGLPEKGETVYDRLLQEDVEYLGKLHYEDTVILETLEGKCYDRVITHLKPLNYKDSPTRQARKEQHKLLEDLVGDVDSNLQGYTHKGGAIELYNKGWRVSKEDV